MAQKTNTELKAYNDANIDTNGANAITGFIHNTMNKDIVDSFANKVTNSTLLGLFPYETNRDYVLNQAVIYNNEIRICTTATTGTFNQSHWGYQAFNTFTAATGYFPSLSADTIYSGSTNLYDIFLTENDGNDITRVAGGTNISTGGTANIPIINLDDDIELNSVSATTISASTIFSGATNLYDIFATSTTSSSDVTRVQGGTNINTGGTGNIPIVNLEDDITLNSVSGTSISATTFYSGSTDLSSLIGTGGGGGTSTPKTFITLTDDTLVNWDLTSSINAQVTLDGSNGTLALSGHVDGDYGTLKVIQDGTGGRTMSLPPNSKSANDGNGAITLSSDADAIDIIAFVFDGTDFYWNSNYIYS